MKKLSILATLASLLLLAGCSDDSKSTDDKCSANVCSEDGTKLIVCDKNSGNTSETPCPTGCDKSKNACNPEASKCSADVCSEDGTKLIVCDKNSGNTSETPCPTGCDKSKNACNPEASKCSADICSEDGTKLIVCDKNSGNTSETPCPTGCDKSKNACNPEASKCSANVCSEDGSKLIVCDKNSGNTSETPCPTGCDKSKNACNPNNLIDKDILEVPGTQNNAEDASCDPLTFVNHCEENKEVYCACQNGICNVMHNECDLDICITTLETATTGQKVNYTACLQKCTDEVDTVVKECSTDSRYDYDILVTKTCAASSKGNVWNEHIDLCATVCTDNSCTANVKCDEDDEDECDNTTGVITSCDDDGYKHVTNCPVIQEGATCISVAGIYACGVN